MPIYLFFTVYFGKYQGIGNNIDIFLRHLSLLNLVPSHVGTEALHIMNNWMFVLNLSISMLQVYFLDPFGKPGRKSLAGQYGFCAREMLPKNRKAGPRRGITQL